MAEANEKPKRSVQIDPGRMRLAEYERQDWVANAPEGSAIEDILQPGFWSLMAAQMKPYDRVEVRADDGTWLAEVLVLGCDRTWAKVHLLSSHQLTTADVSQSQSAKYDVIWKGPQKKWIVLRLADQTIVKEGIPTKDEGFAWMREHEKVVG